VYPGVRHELVIVLADTDPQFAGQALAAKPSLQRQGLMETAGLDDVGTGSHGEPMRVALSPDAILGPGLAPRRCRAPLEAIQKAMVAPAPQAQVDECERDVGPDEELPIRRSTVQ